MSLAIDDEKLLEHEVGVQEVLDGEIRGVPVADGSFTMQSDSFAVFTYS